jgi:hypothetical protein
VLAPTLDEAMNTVFVAQTPLAVFNKIPSGDEKRA